MCSLPSFDATVDDKSAKGGKQTFAASVKEISQLIKPVIHKWTSARGLYML